MPARSQQVVPWLAGALSLVLLALTQSQLVKWRGTQAMSEQLTYLPDGRYLKIAVLGYREVAADLLWLEAIQYMGERKVTEAVGRWLYNALDVITTLDPQFVRAYEAGGIALCTLVVLPDESNRLLEKGIRHNPGEWKLLFLLGINYYFELRDDAKAAEAMALASRVAGAPDYVARLAAKLYVNAKSPQQGVDLLARVYEDTSDANVKKLLEIRLKELIVERDLELLNQALDRYRTMHQQLPEKIEELVVVGILSGLPREPFGGRYLYDQSTGTVRSSEVQERVRVTTRRRGQFAPN